jgi:hypothetical protein
VLAVALYSIVLVTMRLIKKSVISYLYSLSLRLGGNNPNRRRRPTATNCVAEALPVKGSKFLTAWYHESGDLRLPRRCLKPPPPPRHHQ